MLELIYESREVDCSAVSGGFFFFRRLALDCAEVICDGGFSEGG